MPTTAMQFFRDDIARAEALVSHADRLPRAKADQILLREDILRSGWMFTVGAMDAYFCDAYADIVAAVILCKVREPSIALPDHIDDLKVPVSTVLDSRPVRDNWKWRMAARALIERQNILDLGTVQKHFNKFCRKGQKLFTDVVDAWAIHNDATARVFGVPPGVYAARSGAARSKQRDESVRSMKSRFDDVICQRRHDCIHNCDRPKVKPQRLPRAGTVENVIRDVRFLVVRFDQHMDAEVRHFLSGLGFSNTNISQVGY